MEPSNGRFLSPLKSLREHPVPVREEAISAIGTRSLPIDIYIWLDGACAGPGLLRVRLIERALSLNDCASDARFRLR